MDDVIEILREMYSVQHDTDRTGGREVAAWYYLEALQDALGATLWWNE